MDINNLKKEILALSHEEKGRIDGASHAEASTGDAGRPGIRDSDDAALLRDDAADQSGSDGEDAGNDDAG